MSISSDSSDTIVLPLHTNLNDPIDTEIEDILKRFDSASSNIEFKGSTSSLNKLYDLDNLSEDEIPNIPLNKRIKKSTEEDNCVHRSEEYSIPLHDIPCGSKELGTASDRDLLKKLQRKYSSPDLSKEKETPEAVIVLSSSSDSEVECYNHENVFTKSPATKIFNRQNSKNDSDKELTSLSPKTKKRREMEKRRKDRAREKERKQEEAEKKKAMKKLEKEKRKEMLEQQKTMKDNLKIIALCNKPDECIKQMIVESDTAILQKEYGTILKATLKNSGIGFKSKPHVIPKLISWCRKMQTIEDTFLKTTEVKEKHYLLIIEVNEFENLIRNSNLTIHIREVFSLTQSKHLTIAVFGTDKVKGEQHFAITEAQILTKCYFRFVKKNEDVATLVIELTKSVAQIPYKLKKEEKLMLQSEYFNDCNKDTVRVDRNGNGLSRLWQQMLTMFPLARLETAEAITAVYPTPSSLFKAYDTCTTKKEKLIQDLPIRRAIGPCATVRRIGPELSKKSFNFFCSTDNVLI